MYVSEKCLVMDIEISCKSFEAEGSYQGNFITLQLNDVDFGGNTEEVYKKFLEDWYSADVLPESFKASEIVAVYDESELLDEIDNGNIANWTRDNIDASNIEEFIDPSVLEQHIKQYVRDMKIDTLVNK